jgi:hypothetical protein
VTVSFIPADLGEFEVENVQFKFGGFALMPPMPLLQLEADTQF